jgi:hypothetical protein
VHDSDSFISEVSEAVRRDRVASTLSRYGWVIAAVVILLVGGAAVNAWYQAHLASRAAAAGDTMRAALADADPAARAAALGSFAEATPKAAVAARLAQAGSLAATDPEAAAAILAGLSDDGAVPELYRALAALQRVMLLGKDLDPSERQATIEALAAPDAPFRPLALEQRALMRLESGDKAGAIADLDTILAEPTATQALQGRARQLIIAAGGSLPLPPTAPPVAGAPPGEPAVVDGPVDG